MKIFIARHGETIDNQQGFLSGQQDTQLTRKGKEDAKKLAEKLALFAIDLIYCSTLKRAKDTIAPYLQHKHLKIIYTDKLREMDLGIYNGAREASASLQDERGKGVDHKVGGGESMIDVYNRADTFLTEIKEKNAGKNILLVGHNAINRFIIGIIKGYTIEEIYEKKERYPNGEVLEFTL